MSKEKFRQVVRYLFRGLPLAGAAIANLFPISWQAHQFLIMIVLIWFQTLFLLEIFRK